jgi:hypothetical protein
MLGSRKKVALACAAVAVSLAATSVALATTTTLFNGTTVDTVNFNTNSIKLRTKEPINVRVVQRSEFERLHVRLARASGARDRLRDQRRLPDLPGKLRSGDCRAEPGVHRDAGRPGQRRGDRGYDLGDDAAPAFWFSAAGADVFSVLVDNGSTTRAKGTATNRSPGRQADWRPRTDRCRTPAPGTEG